MEEDFKTCCAGKKRKNGYCLSINLVFTIAISTLLFILGVVVGAVYNTVFLGNLPVIYLAAAIVGLISLLIGIVKVCVCDLRC